MKRDSEKDPETDPNALLAKLLIGQVGFSFDIAFKVPGSWKYAVVAS